MAKSRIGPFAVEERLGDPATSSVYLAVQVTQQRRAALRFFDAPLAASNPASKAALAKEVDLLKLLLHPNIARCHGGILEEMEGCIVSELVAGESLQSLLARRGRLSWETAVAFAYQIADGLACAHTAGVLHEDLCPDKLVVREDGVVKIIDFRVNRRRNSWCKSGRQLQLDRAPYRAPEQFLGQEPLTPKCDLYALGCIIHEMLAGIPPYQGATLDEIRAQHLTGVRPRLDTIVLDCPDWLATLVEQLLHREPPHRPVNALAVMAALQETKQRVAPQAPAPEVSSGGFQNLPPLMPRLEAQALLERAERETRESTHDRDAAPFYERAWFLVACLFLLVGGIATWLLWPVSEERLFEKAQVIYNREEGREREGARPHLEQLLAKFPRGAYADEAAHMIDELDMASLERRLRFNVRLGREPENQSDQMLAEAWQFEQFGDRFTALEKYQGLVDLLSAEGPDRPYVNFAQRQIREIEQVGTPSELVDFLEARLSDADKLQSDGKSMDARKIWTGIVRLYGNKREFAVQVERAQSRLDDAQQESPQAAAESEADRPK